MTKVRPIMNQYTQAKERALIMLFMEIGKFLARYIIKQGGEGAVSKVNVKESIPHIFWKNMLVKYGNF